MEYDCLTVRLAPEVEFRSVGQADLEVVHPVAGTIAVLRDPSTSIRALLASLEGPLGLRVFPDLPDLAALQALSSLDRLGILEVWCGEVACLRPLRAPGLGLDRLALAIRPVRLREHAYLRSVDGNFEVRCPGAGVLARVSSKAPEMVLLLMGGPAPTQAAAAFAWLAAGSVCDSAGEISPSDAWQWEWHDLVFHDLTRGALSREPRGATFSRLVEGDVPPDARQHFRGEAVRLPRAESLESTRAPFSSVVLGRRTRRDFDASRPPTILQLGALLDLSLARTSVEMRNHMEVSTRPSPSGGGLSAIDAFLIVRSCAELAQAIYHYESDTHRLRLIGDESATARVVHLCNQPGEWQVAVLFSCRLARVGMKYERIAYSLALQNLGVLYQSMWLAAESAGLSGYPIGGVDSPALTRALGLDLAEDAVLGAMFLGVPNESTP